MTKRLSVTCCGSGRMGSLVAAIARERGHEVRVLDSKSNAGGAGLSREALRGVDVVVEFSVASSALDNVRRAALAGCPIVLGATGWDREPGATDALRRIQEETGVGLLWSPNFSLGMHLFRKVVEEAASLLAADAELDAWIEEAHHAGKADHPSGTALLLARAILDRVPRKTGLLTSLPEGPVPRDLLLVASARGGHQPGLHRVVLDGAEESITLVHEARSRRAFALGAVRAAEWLAGRRGWFTLDDMLAPTGKDQAP